MREFFRRFKLTYSIYNFFHKKELYNNEKIYKKLGLKKKYYSSVSSKDFVGLSSDVTEFSETKKYNFESCHLYNQLDQEDQKSLQSFEDNGFSILKNYLSADQVDKINAELLRLKEENKLKYAYGNKIMFAIHASPLLWDIGNDQNLKEILTVLLQGNPVLFQSINFMMGSEQATHSDSIHMTTYPLGGLLGVWIALEDVAEDNGPLHYYPGSHKLPYYLNADYDNEGSSFFIGNKSYRAYEQMIESKIKGLHLNKVKFKANKGDLLIWHANLFHGGDPHINKNKTRKSMVFHYFKEGSICYHEITQRPALMQEKA